MNSLAIRIQLTSSQLIKALFVLIFINLVALASTGLAHLYGMQRTSIASLVLEQLNLAQENVVATWYSSMLILQVAIMSAICFITERQHLGHWRDRLLSFGWLVFCAMFTLLSFDEIGSFHESIGDTAVFKLIANSDTGGWDAFYVLVGLAALFMLAFVWVKIRRILWALVFAILGVLFFLSNPLQEVYEINAMNAAADPTRWKRPVHWLLLEEGTEIFGSLCFLISVTAYAAGSARNKKGSAYNPALDISFSINHHTVFYLTGLITAGTGTLIWIMQHYKGLMTGDNGIPENWFPSAVAFVIALISFYIYLKTHSQRSPTKRLYLTLSLLDIILSLYFGSNLYSFLLFKNSNWIKLIPNLLLMITAIAIGIKLASRFQNAWSRAGILGWLLLLAAAMVIQLPHIPALGWLAFSCLLFSMVLHAAHQNRIRS